MTHPLGLLVLLSPAPGEVQSLILYMGSLTPKIVRCFAQIDFVSDLSLVFARIDFVIELATHSSVCDASTKLRGLRMHGTLIWMVCDLIGVSTSCEHPHFFHARHAFVSVLDLDL